MPEKPSEPKDVDFGPLWEGETTASKEPTVDIPDIAKEADHDMDITLKWTAAGIAAALLAGYGVKKVVQKRRGNK
ncbi:MAG TPA: hypothetical protein PK096_02015 [Candidatus Saccharibacteria bacterium]|nr:hypothetical protein [Candidatus Saccharibacteria bacterium]HRK94123.1 hypothetical protein [Candidatus Saccharibacteria bacterium]